MTVDIATLGLAVDSSQIPKAIAHLDELIKKSKETTSEAGKLESKNLELGRSWLLQAEMAGKSRAEVIRMQADYQKMTGDARVAAEAAARLWEQKDAAAKTAAEVDRVAEAVHAFAGKIGAALGAFLSWRTAVASVRAFAEAEAVSNKLAASIEITGGRAGRTAEQIEEMAQAMQRTTRFDDEGIKRAADALTKFGSISGDNFDRAIKLSADLAEKMGTDITGAANMVGRALENSFGAQMLKRQGLLNDEQARTIKNLKEMGQDTAAQNALFEALESTVGGLADKMGGQGLETAFKQLNNQLGESAEMLGAAIAKFTGLEEKIRGLTELVADANSEGGFGTVINTFARGLLDSLGISSMENTGTYARMYAQSRAQLEKDADPNRRDLSAAQEAAAAAAGAMATARAREYNEYLKERGELYDKLAIKEMKSHEAVKTRADVERLVRDNSAKAIEMYGSEEEAIKRISATLETKKGKVKDLAAEEKKRADAIHKQYYEEKQGMQREFDAQQKALREAREAIDKTIESVEKSIDMQDKRVEGLERETKALEEEAKTLNMTDEQLRQYNLDKAIAVATALDLEDGFKKEADAAWGVVRALEARNNAARNKEVGDAIKKTADDAYKTWQQTAESIQNSLTDALLRGFESGKDFAKNLRDTLYNMFQTLILRPTIQAILAPIAGGIGGLMPGSAGASSFGGAGSLLGGGGGAFNLFGPGAFGAGSLFGSGGVMGALGGSGGIFGAGGMLNSFALGSTGQALGLSAAGLDALGMTGLTTLGTTLGAALPIIGIALAIAFAMGAFDRGGPKSGGSAGPAGFRQMTPNDQDSAFQQVRMSTSDAIQETLRRFGVTSRIDVGAEGDTDPEGDAPSRARFALYINGVNVRDTGNIDVGRDEGAVQQRLTLEAKRALLFALQQSDLADELDAFFDQFNVDALDADAIDKIVQFGAAFQTVLDLFDNDVLADGLRAYEEGMKGVDWVIDKQIEGIQNLIDEFDGSAEAAEGLALATDALYQAAVQAIAQIENLKAELAEMFGSSQERYRLAGMDNSQQRTYWQNEIDRLTNLINTSNDPAAIGRYARDLDRAQSQLWGLLTPEEQAAQWQNFLSASERAQDFVNDRLIDIQNDIATKTETMIGEVRTVMMEAAANFNAAADTMNTAANTQLVAANTPQTIVVRMPDGSPDVRPGGA